MKNELQTLDQIFSDYLKYEAVMKEYFEKHEYEAYSECYKYVQTEIDRVKNVINEETQAMQDQNIVKLYISQYLIRLSNLIHRITTYKGIYEMSLERKMNQLKENPAFQPEEQLFIIEIHLDTGIKICENALRVLILNLVRDYEYLFDSLENHDQVSIIINDFKKNPLHRGAGQPLPKIKWTKSSKDFVKHFAPLIKDKTLSFKGNSDTESIVRLLHSFFEIDKTKGDGELTFESLSTYFKKENSGDVY